MMATNFLPFARRQNITIPAASGGTLGRVATRFTDLSTGGCVRAHIQDAIIFQGTDWVVGNQYSGSYIGATNSFVRMRYGVYGKQYFTENFYDYFSN